MDWAVRRAGAGDAHRLALIGAATFLETFAGVLDGEAIVDHCANEHSPAAYQRYLADGWAWLVEAADGSAPIGFVLLGKVDLPGAMNDGSDIELKRIYTLSRLHGHGAGMQLMNTAIDHAIVQGFSRVLLGFYVGNSRAQAFYAKHGFAKIADRQSRL